MNSLVATKLVSPAVRAGASVDVAGESSGSVVERIDDWRAVCGYYYSDMDKTKTEKQANLLILVIRGIDWLEFHG